MTNLSNYNVIDCQKLDKSHQWIFLYDNTEQLLQILREMGDDPDCELNWAEIHKLMNTAISLEQSHPLPPS